MVNVLADSVLLTITSDKKKRGTMQYKKYIVKEIDADEYNNIDESNRSNDKLNKIRCCANCKYWYCYDEEKFKKGYATVEGECHRFPPNVPNIYYEGHGLIPSVETIRGTPLMSHPFTFTEEWCGEFSPIKNPKY